MDHWLLRATQWHECTVNDPMLWVRTLWCVLEFKLDFNKKKYLQGLSSIQDEANMSAKHRTFRITLTCISKA